MTILKFKGRFITEGGEAVLDMGIKGISPDYEYCDIYIDVECLESFNDAGDGTTVLRMISGNDYTVMGSVDVIFEMLKQLSDGTDTMG
jgi:hypothetical protein